MLELSLWDQKEPELLTQFIVKGKIQCNCDVLNENGFHQFTGSGTVRRYVLVGVGVVLLEEACYHASCYDGNKLKV